MRQWRSIRGTSARLSAAPARACDGPDCISREIWPCFRNDGGVIIARALNYSRLSSAFSVAHKVCSNLRSRIKNVSSQTPGGGAGRFAVNHKLGTDPNGRWIKSCSILTKPPNAVTSQVHDHMPVILGKNDYDLWLDPGMTNVEAISDLLKPLDARLMRMLPMSSRVNQVGNWVFLFTSFIPRRKLLPRRIFS